MASRDVDFKLTSCSGAGFRSTGLALLSRGLARNPLDSLIDPAATNWWSSMLTSSDRAAACRFRAADVTPERFARRLGRRYRQKRVEQTRAARARADFNMPLIPVGGPCDVSPANLHSRSNRVRDLNNRKTTGIHCLLTSRSNSVLRAAAMVRVREFRACRHMFDFPCRSCFSCRVFHRSDTRIAA